MPAPGDPQAFNRYAYARNNPIRYTDPTGHSFWDSIKSWIGDIAGAVMGVVTFAMTGNIMLSMAAYSFTSGFVNGIQSGYNIAEAYGIGAITGSAGYLGASIGGAMGGASKFASAMLAGSMGGAAGGATHAGLTGGNVGRAALAGAAGGAIAGFGGYLGGPYSVAGKLAAGGAGAEIAGGEFSQGALRSVASAAASGSFQVARDVAAKPNRSEGTSTAPKLSTALEKQHKADRVIAQSAVSPGATKHQKSVAPPSGTFGVKSVGAAVTGLTGAAFLFVPGGQGVGVALIVSSGALVIWDVIEGTNQAFEYGEAVGGTVLDGPMYGGDEQWSEIERELKLQFR